MTFKSQSLALSALATATAGMSSCYDLPTRALIFTVHLKPDQSAQGLCSALYTRLEQLIGQYGHRLHSAAHIGLMAFLDYEGSRFTGAARSTQHPHLHGTLFVPHFAREDLERIAENLTFVANTFLGVLRPAGEVQIKVFEPEAGQFLGGLVNWTQYASKDAQRREDGQGMILLPFDRRDSLTEQARGSLLRTQERHLIAFEKMNADWLEAQASPERPEVEPKVPAASPAPLAPMPETDEISVPPQTRELAIQWHEASLRELTLRVLSRGRAMSATQPRHTLSVTPAQRWANAYSFPHTRAAQIASHLPRGPPVHTRQSGQKNHSKRRSSDRMRQLFPRHSGCGGTRAAFQFPQKT